MKKIALILVVSLLTFVSCSTTGFLGLASAEYVDKTAQKLTEQQAAEIQQLKGEIEKFQAFREQTQAAIDQVSQTAKTIEDLQGIAKQAQERFGQLPREVIQQLVEILQAYLAK